MTLGGVLTGANGGTGHNNGSSVITLGGSLTTSGAFASTFTMTNTTSVTFPTSGTLATTSQLPTPAALTSSNDTNVTITLGGTPSTALLQATSLTMGWTGQLAVSRGGTGISSFGTGVATALGQNVSGSGGIALTTSPIFTTPTLGAASATSINFGGSTLSTYVTGTWTPTITPATLGDWSVVYATQQGNYTQIGNLVTITCNLTFTPTFTTASGALTINALPVSVNATYYGMGPIGFMNGNWTWGTGITQLFIAPHVSSTTANIIGIGSTKANVTFAVSNIVASGASTQLYFTVTYFA